MKVSQLIAKLAEVIETQGDLNVTVQYRDAGGDYIGSDENIYLWTDDKNKTLTL